MNINAVNKIAEFYTLSNIKNIDKKEDLQLMKISADRYENNSFQNISLSNPYGFQEMGKIMENISINQEENKDYTIDDIQSLLFRAVFNTSASSIDKDLLPENEKLKERIEKMIDEIIEKGNTGSEEVQKTLAALREKLEILDKLGDEEILSMEDLDKILQEMEMTEKESDNKNLNENKDA